MGQEKESLASKLDSLRQRPLLLDNVINFLLTTLNNLIDLQDVRLDDRLLSAKMLKDLSLCIMYRTCYHFCC